MRALFVVLPERGHWHPMLGCAHALLARGHEVSFTAPRDIGPALRGAAIERFLPTDPRAPDATNRGAELAALVRDPVRLAAWVERLLLGADGDLDGEVERLGAVVREVGPDVIVADPMAYAAPIVATRAGIPWAALSSSLNPVVPDALDSDLVRTVRALEPRRRALFARHGLPDARFRVCDCLSPHLTVAFTTRELVGEPPEGVTLVGSALPVRPRGDGADLPRLDGRPLVYASFGSQIFHQPRAFQTIRAAARGLGVQLVLSAGDLAPALDAPPDVLAVPYAPQLELLSRASAMITHGGANSITEALHHGVPLLVSPVCNDQPHGAWFATRSGVGLALDVDAAPPAAVRDALARLIDASGSHRAAARRVARAYRAAGGGERTAELVAALACAPRTE